MTLDFYIKILTRMLDEQEVTIVKAKKELSKEDLAIEIGIQTGIQFCLNKAKEIE